MRSSHHCFSRIDTGPKDDQTAEQGEEKLWEQLEVNISFRNHYSYLLLKELKKDALFLELIGTFELRNRDLIGTQLFMK